jgi:hypothetical protein
MEYLFEVGDRKESLVRSCLQLLHFKAIQDRHSSQPSQETPQVGVEDRSDYLRSGNVKPDDQSLGLPDQETS